MKPIVYNKTIMVLGLSTMSIYFKHCLQNPVFKLGCTIFLVIQICFISGCARKVTEKLYPAEDIELTFSCQQVINLQFYSYYLIFSDTSSPVIPYQGHYFFAPGENFSEERLNQMEGLTIQDYYSNYFSSWKDYILVYDTVQKPKIFNGQFSPSSNATAHYNYTYQLYFNPEYAYQTTKLTFSMSNLSIQTNKIYITLVSVMKQSGQVVDVLNLNPFVKETGSELSGYGVDNNNIPAPANFKSWKVRIF